MQSPWQYDMVPRGQGRASGNRRAGFSEGGSRGDEQELLSIASPGMLFLFFSFFLILLSYNLHPIKFTVVWVIFFSSQALSLPIQLILLSLLFCKVCRTLKLHYMGLLKIMCKPLQHRSVQLFLSYAVTTFYITYFQTFETFFQKRYVAGFSTIFQVMMKVVVFLPCDC